MSVTYKEYIHNTVEYTYNTYNFFLSFFRSIFDFDWPDKKTNSKLGTQSAQLILTYVFFFLLYGRHLTGRGGGVVLVAMF